MICRDNLTIRMVWLRRQQLANDCKKNITMAEFEEVTSGISKEVFFFFYTFIFKESYPGEGDHPKQLKVI